MCFSTQFFSSLLQLGKLQDITRATHILSQFLIERAKFNTHKFKNTYAFAVDCYNNNNYYYFHC